MIKIIKVIIILLVVASMCVYHIKDENSIAAAFLWMALLLSITIQKENNS